MAATVDGVTAAEVARPADVEGVREIVRSAARAGKTIVATGLGAHLDVGMPPRRVDVLLDLSALARIVDHEGADMTVTVQAGCSLAQLDATLSAAGQWLPLDPPAFERTTVGGLIAANLSGPLRASRGTVRDLLLGLRLVDGTGALVSGGGKVVKNVAGYDLGKLVCGSEGRLALIARVSLRLHPLPAAAATLVVETDDPAGVVRALRRSQLQPSALDVHHPGRVAVLFEGREGAVAEQMDAARALVGGGPGDASVWEEARGRQARALGRLAFAPRDLGNVLSTLTEAVVRPAAGIAYVPHRVGGVPPAAARRLQRALKARLDPEGVLT
jgi:glycolate oxidase FAD binding subunit